MTDSIEMKSSDSEVPLQGQMFKASPLELILLPKYILQYTTEQCFEDLKATNAVQNS